MQDTNTNSIDHFMNVVNKNHEQVKSMIWGHLAKSIVYGAAKLIGFGIFLWVIRHI